MPKDVFPRYPRTLDHMPDGDPVGVAEMCLLTGRSRPAVRKWIERGALPPADGPWVGGPTWRRRTFLPWAYGEGYLRDPYGKELPAYEEGRHWTGLVPVSRLVSWRELQERGRTENLTTGWEDEGLA